MPELPEVETIRTDLDKLLRGKRVLGVVAKKDKMVRGKTALFKKKLKGAMVQKIGRRGKLLVVSFGNKGFYLLIHLKMTGQLIYQDKKRLVGGGHGEPRVKKDELPNKYSHIVLDLSGGAKLFFNDMRQFGFMRLVNEKQLRQVLSGYGVEPLSDGFTVDLLRNILRNRKTAVKNVLLDQRCVAGLGNIYTDESCWLAGVRPTKKANKITAAQASKLHRAIRSILKRAIKMKGTTFDSYRDGQGGEGKFVRYLKVYGRAGLSCRRCGRVLKRTKVGGRGTVYCSNCQK